MLYIVLAKMSAYGGKYSRPLGMGGKQKLFGMTKPRNNKVKNKPPPPKRTKRIHLFLGV